MANGSLDILGRRPQVVKRAYSSDELQIVIAGPDHDFMLVQNMAMGYQQNVTRLYDLENADFQAYVASRPQGQLTVGNVVTNLDSMLQFMQQYGDVCEAETGKNIVVSLEGKGNDRGLCRQQGGSISFSQPVLVSTSLSVAVADYVVNSQMAFIFASALPAGNTGGTTT